MTAKVLVTYGTKYGATAEIAEKIGLTLREQGFEVDIIPAKNAGSPAEYGAVVVGSAVYMGQWRKDAASFLKNNEELLSGLPVWLFSSGPAGEGDPVELLKGWRYPKGLAPVIERIKPKDIAVFHGVVEPAKLNFFYKWIINRVKSPFGDFRDWAAIAKWAEGIAAAVKKG